MSTPYDSAYTPPMPVLRVHLAAPGEPPPDAPFSAIVGTGTDATLVPSAYLEQVEAVASGDAVLRGVLGESREIHLYEVDLHIDTLLLSGVLVVGDDYGLEVILGRNVLNKFSLLLDGQRGETEIVEQRAIL
jgi:hypothetical protein